jgi:hypothetical protein
MSRTTQSWPLPAAPPGPDLALSDPRPLRPQDDAVSQWGPLSFVLLGPSTVDTVLAMSGAAVKVIHLYQAA